MELLGKKIAIYGLGTETERFLHENGAEMQVIGLLDGFRETGELYGLQIVSLHDILAAGVDLILVIARPGSCKAIAKRIGDFCKEHSIELYDVRGKNLLVEEKVLYDFSHVEKYKKIDLLNKIAEADVVSFDLFDTLVMRQVLESTDIHELVNIHLKENKIYIDSFEKRRIGSEKELSIHTAPTLKEIYEYALKDIPLTNTSAAQLADLEWKIDYDTIIPRTAVCECLKYAVEKNKKVYIVSDTYYSSEQLKQILLKCEINTNVKVLASCEWKTSKTQNLFSVLKEDSVSQKILHIGDDIVADEESAKKYGIDAYRIYSGVELFDALGGLGTNACTQTIVDKIKCGLFVSRLFNNPFQFEDKDCKVNIISSYDVGYLFCAPMITDFMFWFDEEARAKEIKNIWLSARDGYLIKRLYKILDTERDVVYFLTSRIAAIRAGMVEKADIEYVNSMKYSGTIEQCLKTRFGIETDSLAKKDSLLEYEKEIFDKAIKGRANYSKYLNQVPIYDGDIAFFDFVAKGTTQMYVQKLLSNHIKGFYFIQLEPEFMASRKLDINAFYKQEEVDSSSIFENYYILETILTAPHPSVSEFDENGQPVYAKETRERQHIECVLRIQKGIEDYFGSYIKLSTLLPKGVNKALNEVFLDLVHRIQINDADFTKLIVEDPFFNRNTNVIDII